MRKATVGSQGKVAGKATRPYVIVRGDKFGAFAGTLESRQGDEVELSTARRLWYWDGAASLSQLAMEGVKAPQNCKFPCPVASIVLLGVIELIPCTDLARGIIESVPVWQR